MARSIQIVAVLLLASRLDAAPILINVTDPNADYFARQDNCMSWPVETTKYTNCVNNANLSTTALGEDDALFLDAFVEWNFTNAAGSQWVLAYGGELPGGAFNVSKFDTLAGLRRGAVEIRIDWTYAGADKSEFKWSQAIESNNLKQPPSFVEPFFDMDVRTGACNNNKLDKQCPPLYPFQYADRHFYDRPQGLWPNGFFFAAAFLTKADFETRILTYYEGVHYSFRLSADEAGPNPDPDDDPDIPEPSILALALVGAACMRLRKPSRTAGTSFDRTSSGRPDCTGVYNRSRYSRLDS